MQASTHPHGRGAPVYGTRSAEAAQRVRLTDPRILRWFAVQLKTQWHRVLLGTAAMLLASAAALVWPRMLQPTVDNVIVKQQYNLLSGYIRIIVLAYVAQQLFSAMRMNVMHILGQRFVFDLRLQCYQHLQKLSLSYFDDHATGDTMSRLSNDVNAVEDMVVHGVDEVISSIILVAGIIVIVALKFEGRTPLLLAGLWPLPFFLAGIIIFARYVRPIYKRIREDLGDINTELEESITGIRVVKAFGREDHELDRFRERSWNYFRANVRGIWMWTTFFPLIGFLTSMGSVTALWLGASPGPAGQPIATAGEMMMFLSYLGQFYGPMGNLVRVYDTFNRALAAITRIFQILDEEPEIRDHPDAVDLHDVRGEVELEGVTFRYRTGEAVLNRLTLHADPGETVAIVGRSGAGKTSLINLVPRFYDPVEGRVMIDGHDIRYVTSRSLRENIALVLQETFLFDGTVRDNIAYGRLDASDEEIVAAAEAAYAHEFIVDMPDGYETRIGERGTKMSGGQRQRLAIARALLADPRILILDEATSLVDTEAEQKIQAALENLTRGRTVFVIAHRLSTVRKANKIVVLEDGEVVEEDSHENLMARGGLYAEMYQRQFNVEDVWQQGAAALERPGP
jgi:ABC-type multidrug transport system fused ATPase/permease subunit